ncbi:MAG: ABC transporter permease [Mailhella sp.]|nr:ABC transporter permease [Mailhella sp.]
MDENKQVTWAFRRLGGMDQVTLETSGELSRLRDLDPKLWATLSCPATGLEFNAQTLALLDSDKDGRIRIPEVLDAMDWLCDRISNPSEIVARPEALPLASIRQDTPEGVKLHATAINVLQNLGKADSDCVSEADVEGAASIANALLYNGDGIVPPHADLTDEQREFVSAALQVVGGELDSSGESGVSKTCITAFLSALEAEKSWRKAVAEAPHPLGNSTGEAWALAQDLKEKISDYFLRCRMAAFAPQSVASLNAEEVISSSGNNGLLSHDVLESLPLSQVKPDSPLCLKSGINPVWRDKACAFAAACSSLLPEDGCMTEEAWINIQSVLAPYGAVLAQRSIPAGAGSIAPADPAGALAALSDAQVDAMLSCSAASDLESIIEKDLSVPSASSDISELDKLVLYYRHLHRLLMNFVSFYDFYSLKRPATFQAGTLFIDGRSCRLCLPVTDVDKHSGMAALSQICLLYCHCTRVTAEGSKAMNIAAAMTAGSDTFLREGRNGVYVDDEGNDWDATVVKVVRNPISIKQAMWSPYLRVSQMIHDQIAKFAADKQAKVMAGASQKVADTAAAPAKPAMPFDIGKSVGIFAAVGIALGAIGTAVGSIASMIMSLHWWQFPLLFLAIFICISGPSMFLAWLKLRKRTLGPLLEASGWAVNSQLPINQVLGRALTKEASLPSNSTKIRNDPLHQESPAGKIILAVILALALLLGYLGWKYKDAVSNVMKSAVTVEQPAAPAPAAAAPAAEPAPEAK